jgi:hypothetical protein
MQEDRALALFGQLIEAIGGFLALAALGLTVYSSSTGRRVTRIRSQAGSRLRDQFTAAVIGPVVALAAIIVAYVVVANYHQPWGRWLVVAALILLGTRGARMIYFFTRTVGLNDQDQVPAREPRPLSEYPVRQISTGTRG